MLTLFAKRKKNVRLLILTGNVSKQFKLDVQKFNAQHPPVKVRVFNKAHDRFMIIYKATVYHFGASLKDLGRKWFAFSRMDMAVLEMLGELEGYDG